MRKIRNILRAISQEDEFLHLIENVEVFVSKILSIAMLIVIAVAIFDLGVYLVKELFTTDYGTINTVLFNVFGLFLNILIALELLENITAYLRKHVVQLELVIVTSLIAVARKIIILNIDKVEGIEIIGLGTVVLALSISYWIIRTSNKKD
ncbi:MAG: phosphate-starvation-inducible PsiE family protein [Calothrix sp. MO_192.B10]|nr:phosphate-starvation-inducible PsiE family protein [Calothrix sp. MO_192.B10]